MDDRHRDLIAPGPAVPFATGRTSDPADRLVAPSPELVATVRHAAPPDAPPDELVPFVVPVVVDGELDDWHLGLDALALGSRHIPRAFAAWRRRWERAWVLDPESSVDRLCSAVDEVVPGSSGRRSLAGLLADGVSLGHRTEIAPAMQPVLVSALDRARGALRARGRGGYGFVDCTSGARSTGFARTWSPQHGSEVLAADDSLIAAMQPETGLSIACRRPECDGDPGALASLGARRVVDRVDQVELAGESVRVSGASGSLHLGLADARVLGWLVPGAATWRVRTIPEVLVWACTFAGLADSCTYASSLGVPVVVASSRPFAAEPG